MERKFRQEFEKYQIIELYRRLPSKYNFLSKYFNQLN